MKCETDATTLSTVSTHESQRRGFSSLHFFICRRFFFGELRRAELRQQNTTLSFCGTIFGSKIFFFSRQKNLISRRNIHTWFMIDGAKCAPLNAFRFLFVTLLVDGFSFERNCRMNDKCFSCGCYSIRCAPIVHTERTFGTSRIYFTFFFPPIFIVLITVHGTTISVRLNEIATIATMRLLVQLCTHC